MSNDSGYYVARATEERRLAMASANSKIRRIHLEMASRYAALAGTNATYVEGIAPEAVQQTA